MPARPTFRQRLRYAFDNTLARGPIALIAWLAVVTALVIAVAVALDLLLGGTSPQLGPFQVFWDVLYQALVPNPVDPNNPIQFLLIMLFVTLASLAVVSILIGLLSASIENRVERLRRGRSQIIESGHTVILGWSEPVFSIISELVAANQNRRQASIAILGDVDQVEMEDQIRHRVRSAGHTRVVCRRGSATEHADLDLVSVQTSKSIIILTDTDEHPDAAVIKTILAITQAPDRRPEPYQIVAVIRDPENVDIARQVGRDEVELVQYGDVIACLIAQTCRQAGLSSVYQDLLDFAGDEIYFQAEPDLVGKTFGEALLAYEDSAVMGLVQNNVPRLAVPPDTVIQAGDRVIAISEDDDTVRLRPAGAPAPRLQLAAIQPVRTAEPRPERTLILGWNWRAPAVIMQLDAYAVTGSAVDVIAEHATVAADMARLRSVLRHLEAGYQPGDIGSRAVLESIPVGVYDHVIILCYSDTLDNQRADALTLLALLHLRRIAGEGGHRFSLTSEMMDVRNRNLAESARADDFIVSDRLISLLLAQVSENPGLNSVFRDLLDPAGVEIYLKPAEDYIQPGQPVSFYTVVEAARRRGEVAVGYRLAAFEAARERAYGVVLNPDKSKPVAFAPADRVIVLAQA